MHHAGLIDIHDELLIPHAEAPSSQPATCSTKLTPPRQVGSRVLADSNAACASESGSTQTAAGAKRHAQGAAPTRPSRTARAQAPECRRSARRIASRSRSETSEHDGRTGVHELQKRHPGERFRQRLRYGAGTVTGDMAPARMKGVMMQA